MKSCVRLYMPLHMNSHLVYSRKKCSLFLPTCPVSFWLGEMLEVREGKQRGERRKQLLGDSIFPNIVSCKDSVLTGQTCLLLFRLSFKPGLSSGSVVPEGTPNEVVGSERKTNLVLAFKSLFSVPLPLPPHFPFLSPPLPPSPQSFAAHSLRGTK